VANPAFLPCSFFARDPLVCARELIGTELVWGKCSGLIVETEAYLTLNDEACHTFTRPSTRAFVERNEAGAIYIYMNYAAHLSICSDARRCLLPRSREVRVVADPRIGISRSKDFPWRFTLRGSKFVSRPVRIGPI